MTPDFKLIELPRYVGFYGFGVRSSSGLWPLSLQMERKPPFLHRWMLRTFFGIQWIDGQPAMATADAHISGCEGPPRA